MSLDGTGGTFNSLSSSGFILGILQRSAYLFEGRKGGRSFEQYPERDFAGIRLSLGQMSLSAQVQICMKCLFAGYCMMQFGGHDASTRS